MSNWNFNWACEKWSEEACVHVRRKLGLYTDAEISSVLLREIVGPAEILEEIPGNLLVNEGIQRMLDLLIGVAVTNYAAANSFIGVGDSAAAEAATQVELQAASNRFYKAMNATFPSRTSQTVSWQSDFTTSEANYAWAEWTICSLRRLPAQASRRYDKPQPQGAGARYEVHRYVDSDRSSYNQLMVTHPATITCRVCGERKGYRNLYVATEAIAASAPV